MSLWELPHFVHLGDLKLIGFTYTMLYTIVGIVLGPANTLSTLNRIFSCVCPETSSEGLPASSFGYVLGG